jgi:hypothetical protein
MGKGRPLGPAPHASLANLRDSSVILHRGDLLDPWARERNETQ